MSAECRKCGFELARTIKSDFHCYRCENKRLQSRLAEAEEHVKDLERCSEKQSKQYHDLRALYSNAIDRWNIDVKTLNEKLAAANEQLQQEGANVRALKINLEAAEQRSKVDAESIIRLQNEKEAAEAEKNKAQFDYADLLTTATTPPDVQCAKQNAELLQWCEKQTLFIRKVADTVPEKGSEYWAIQSEACDLVKEANESLLE